jgi:hypothetical protein
VANELTERVERILSSAKALPGTTEVQFKRAQEHLIEQYKRELARLRKGVLVERRFQTPIERVRAQERTEDETRRIIDLLRYVIAYLYPAFDDMLIGLQGDVRRDRRSTLTFPKEDGVDLRVKSTGLHRDFVLPTKDVDAMNHIGLFAMSEVLKKPEASLEEYDRMLIRGLRLFSNSQIQFEKHSQLIGLWDCLENFLSPEHSFTLEDPKRAAILLTPDAKEREDIREWLRDTYVIRSNESHGKSRIITEADLEMLKRAAVLIIRWMIEHRNDFCTRSKLLDWLKLETLKQWP